MRRSIHSPRARRRGQALLLAVLIMIFAALLSAAFIGVVAVNLSQTARQGDKNIALASARAGLEYVNKQLTYSPRGDRWNPQSLIPQPTDPGYQYYYSEFDKAQGWEGTFAKFPDPRGFVTEGPNFMAKVDRVPLTLQPTDPEFDKIGALRITVIGYSPEDPTAYSRIVAYKGGVQRAPIGQVIRVVSNYDFNTKQPVVGTFSNGANNGTGATPVLDIRDATGDFEKLGKPFTITIANPNSNVTAVSGVVTEVTSTGQRAFSLKLAQPLAVAPPADSRVELAANIGGINGLDAANRPLQPSPITFSPLTLSDTQAGEYLENQVDGARVNGGLVLTGDVDAQRIRFTNSYGGNTISGHPTIPKIASYIRASGLIALQNSTVDIKDAETTVTDTLQSSSSTGLFQNGNANPDVKQQLVADGWNRIKGVPSSVSPSRSVPDFQPPIFDSGEGLERYRNIARYATGVASRDGKATAQAGGGLYGNGAEGIYIDNASDKETIAAGGGVFREMTQTELMSMWLSEVPAGGTVEDYMRNGAPQPLPALGTPATVSLEQMHLRGWVGPDEFRARGVEIELQNGPIVAGVQTPPVIKVTRDARDDGADYLGGSLRKAWKDPSNGNPLTGVYTETLPWPTNGIIFAEGNIRIKGTAALAPNSLTVVSMGNIYIEDSLGIDDDLLDENGDTTPTTRKVLLLAKKNVVMNPTRVMGRPDVQTTVDEATPLSLTSGTATGVEVTDTSNFNVGDFVQTMTSAGIEAQGYVTAITGNELTVNVTKTGTVSNGDLVTTPNIVPAWAPTSTVPATSINEPTDVYQRRVKVPATAALADVRFAFNHFAEKIDGLSVGTADVGPQYLADIYFANKGIFPVAPVRSASNQAEAKLQVDFQGPVTPGTDTFPATAPTSRNAADVENLTKIAADMNLIQHVDPAPGGQGWKYDVAVSDPAAYGNLPFYQLAGVGNRLDFGAPKGSPDERRKSINKNSGATYIVPLATSISFVMNGAGTTMFNENWNTTLTPVYFDRTSYFGFRPFLDTAPVVPDEDILTSDQGFYQTGPGLSTLDSRSLTNTPAGTFGVNYGENSLVMRQTDGIIQPTAVTPPKLLPAYLLLGSKMENVHVLDTTSEVTKVLPAYTFNVNAYVYAQTGSWFVIPTPKFDTRLRGTPDASFLDINGNGTPEAGEYAKGVNSLGVLNSGPGLEAGDHADLNRNGQVDEFEKTATLRYSRYNYEVRFMGAIAENQTPLVADAGPTGAPTAKGAVADWMDKLATVNYDLAISPTPTYDRIKYVFDPSLAQGSLQNEEGFLLPQTEEIYNIS